MSIKVMSQVWELDMDPSLKLTLLAFADHADDYGVCYPSIRRIAWKSGVTRRTVQRHVRQLEEDGVLRLVEKGGGRGNPTTYRVAPEKGDTLTPFSGEGDRKGVTDAEKATSDAKKGDTGDARTISNRHGNHGAHARGNGRTSGEPKTPGHVTLSEQRCPQHDEPLIVKAPGLWCSACGEWKEAEPLTA